MWLLFVFPSVDMDKRKEVLPDLPLHIMILSLQHLYKDGSVQLVALGNSSYSVY